MLIAACMQGPTAPPAQDQPLGQEPHQGLGPRPSCLPHTRWVALDWQRLVSGMPGTAAVPHPDGLLSAEAT